MSANNPENEALTPIANLDKLIHEPARLMILSFLYVVNEADFTFTLHQTGLSRGNLSTHLSKLDNAGLIIITKQFMDKRPLTLLRLSKKGREDFEKYRVDIQGILDNLPNIK